jgi:hypothetical protein
MYGTEMHSYTQNMLQLLNTNKICTYVQGSLHKSNIYTYISKTEVHKHLNSPSEAVAESKLRGKKVSSTENKLAAACSRFGTEIGEEVEGPSMWIGRGVSIQVEDKGNLL